MLIYWFSFILSLIFVVLRIEAIADMRCWLVVVIV